MESQPKNDAPTLASLMLAFQAEANAMLVAAGYTTTTAQVEASTLPTGLYFSVSAPNRRTVFHENLSYGMATTPEAALNDFNARLVPAEALAAGLVKEAA
jgi:hypothetical protein